MSTLELERYLFYAHCLKTYKDQVERYANKKNHKMVIALMKLVGGIVKFGTA
jgi:hypothetical protein